MVEDVNKELAQLPGNKTLEKHLLMEERGVLAFEGAGNAWLRMAKSKKY